MLCCGIIWLMIIAEVSSRSPFLILCLYVLAPLPVPKYYSPAPLYAPAHSPTPMSLPQAP